MSKKYYCVDDSIDRPDNYSGLVGPDGFECVLTEPEDRIWSRDLEPVVNELNKLYAIVVNQEISIISKVL